MNHDVHQKVKASHLKRTAYLYVRQSSLRQVFENTESTQRQYGLREQAVALGWPLERIIVIDSDLGLSGASSDREGFRRLVTEVSLAHVGIVLGLEVSRLARNSTDWHRLLEICTLTALSRTRTVFTIHRISTIVSFGPRNDERSRTARTPGTPVRRHLYKLPEIILLIFVSMMLTIVWWNPSGGSRCGWV